MIRCVYCATTKTITFDHLVSRVNGGGDEPANLVPACRTCNIRKGKADGRPLSCGHYTYLAEDRCLVEKCSSFAITREETLGAVQETASLALQWRIERDDAVRLAVSAGHPLRTVAEAAGLSHAAIARIAKR